MTKKLPYVSDSLDYVYCQATTLTITGKEPLSFYLTYIREQKSLTYIREQKSVKLCFGR